MKSSSNIEVGYVARPHGVAGELRIITHDPNSETLTAVSELFLNGERFEIARSRKVSGAYLVRLKGVDGRDRAAELRGAAVAVDRDAIELDEGEVLLADLVGCRVVLPDDSDWGEVVRVDVGPQDRLIIHYGDVERMLPFVPELVISIDVEQRVIVVDPPEGMPETKRGR